MREQEQEPDQIDMMDEQELRFALREAISRIMTATDLVAEGLVLDPSYDYRARAQSFVLHNVKNFKPK